MREYSVGIPVRNEENTIASTLESILDQTIPPNEILVCVNGSTDNTYEIVEDMALGYRNIRLLTSAPGKANAWNEIMRQTDDNYMMFCDGDVLVNHQAAENMLNMFEENANLALIGGANAQYSSNPSFFLRYFMEESSGRVVKQNSICGRLYMMNAGFMNELAHRAEIALMPNQILNEDTLLHVLSRGHHNITDSAYCISSPVSTFKDWFIEFKRLKAGQKQISTMFPQLLPEHDLSPHRAGNYMKRFLEIDGPVRKIGVFSMFCLRVALNAYYKGIGNLDNNTIWSETKTTKVAIPRETLEYSA